MRRLVLLRKKNGDLATIAKDGGRALYFDGDGDYLKVTKDNGSLLTGVNEVTVSFMMKTEDSGRANWPFYAAPSESGQTNKYEKYIGLLESSGSLKAERYNSNNNDRPDGAEGSNDTGVWTHVTVVNSSNEIRLYVDGILVDTQESSVALADMLGSGSVFQIGKANWNSGEYFKGWLDDVTIANYAMTEEEVQVLSGKTSVYSRIMNLVGNGVPVVVNKSLYAKDANSYELKKLAAAFMQSASSNVFGRVGLAGKAVSTLSYQDMSNSLIGESAYVNENAFIYDDGAYQVVSKEFNSTIYDESEIEAGFMDVVTEIENENFYLGVAGKSERISGDITMAAAIRHVINYGDRRVVTKSSLRVLDLEPYDFEDYYATTQGELTAYQDIKTGNSDEGVNVASIVSDSICITDSGQLNTKQWIIDHLATQFEMRQDDLDVTIMGTKEFIGKQEDLNAQYDLIYLGLDTSIMNTELDWENSYQASKSDNTVYNDISMNGLVYSHMGDKIAVSSPDDGSLLAKLHGDYYLSGNDITKDKLRELKEYIEAGYAMIISDGFLKNTENGLGVNTDKIDLSSNMYKLIDETVLAKDTSGAFIYYGKNVNTKSLFEATDSKSLEAKETFSKYLGISKLTLKYDKQDIPVAYNQEDGSQQYLSADSDGVYRLHYKMELENDSAVDLASTSYDCQLYVDMDVDGRYEENEILTGLHITDGNGSIQTTDSAGKYHLRAGNTYYISREIPEGYSGFLSWKLSFNQNERTYSGANASSIIRSAVTGFSAVPVSGVKPTIKILQITNYNGQTNLDLAGEDMRLLYNNVNDFSIDVTKISSEEYIGKTTFSQKSYKEFLYDYDMVVLGFADLYVFGWENENQLYADNIITEAVLAIRSYALSGRSVMFTHDLNSSMIEVDSPTHWGYYANKYLRDVQGMDRFGELQNTDILKQEEYLYYSLYDEAKRKGNVVNETTALANSVILTSEHKAGIERNKYGETARRASWEYSYFWNYKDHANGYNDSHVFNSWVEQVNAGQITEYPYKISQVFEVTQSHPQYFQLNLDTDSRDEYLNDDIVVWYTLGEIPGWPDSYYKGVEKDVRNNYFIYNKGNVTYTGSGDRMISSDMEKKLFVNTLVASYRSGTHAARTFFKENEWETSATITGMYLPYDPAMNSGSGGFLQDTLAVNFKISNMDLRKSDEQLHVKYYVDGDGTDAEHTIILDGKPYKEIVPVKAYRLTAQDGTIVKSEENAATLSNNSMHQVEFTYESLGLMPSQESIRNKHTTNIYVRLGYDKMEEKGEVSLPASESISGLNIVCTQLFELK